MEVIVFIVSSCFNKIRNNFYEYIYVKCWSFYNINEVISNFD